MDIGGIGLFDWVGLNKNVGKTVRMVFCPFQAAGTKSEAAYEKCMAIAGTSYWERQRVQVQCLECWK